MSGIDWSKAKEGYDVHIEWSHSAHFYRIEGDRYVRDNGYYAVIEEAHQEALAITFRPWSGEGLPPVGVDCEYYWASDDSWRHGTCVAHFGGRAVICDRDDEDCAERLDAHHVRPIRTPEQIAADEREKAISEIAGILGCLWSSEREAAAFLLDAGYRKVEVKP